ncbi:TetR/AcrR family transcriptional regulator [Aeromicrobium phragmitis]|uniref:TetR/AcrR family transcriptional regulator n=1 Tax=Aeromicrobium phragmitis TaxID=2478914 RepID=A0A3L8PK63_9ACTN|nr:TetR/AcrR family transcriptional regulator [Aeromicrobium phragmitis]RLV55103.1 TetR/AcrR family transcriptional regulator [Aeromicrobium phragmitis]
MGSETPRRQARGQQRIQQILHAAAAIFAERGYDAATTNAIAAQAGISPGSLYQFFGNKDEIARALATHYAEQLRGLAAETFAPSPAATADLDELVDGLLTQLIAFNIEHPGFKALFARTDMPAGLRAAVQPVHASIHERVAALVAGLLADRPPEDTGRIATVTIQLVRAMMPLICEATNGTREALGRELHQVVVSYLRAQGA